jgi:hypothetical protein
MPVDHRLQELDHGQRGHARILQHRARGVAQAQATDHHVQACTLQRRQTQSGQRLFRDGERAGHQELVAELDLVHLALERQLQPVAQADRPDRRGAVSEFLEQRMHACFHDGGGQKG